MWYNAAMKTRTEPISQSLASLAEACTGGLSDAVFFDIETTGLSPKSAVLYLIGAAFEEEDRFVLCQYLAEDLSEEEALLSAFSERISGKKRLFHFNGTTFDVPFFQARCRKYGLPCALPEMEQTDLYRQISPYKNALKLSSCRLKTLEEFLGSHRADPFTGGQLIALYQEYRISRDERLLAAMLLHNADDIRGMLSVLSMLAYPALAGAEAEPDRAELASCTDYAGNPGKELLLPVRLPLSLPRPLALHADGVFFSGKERSGLLKAPVFCGELKHFYPDYKNYSYLPEEDCAIHRSVAVYVDKAHRLPATPETCYTRRTGEFLPLFLPCGTKESAPEEALFAPLFFRQAPGRRGKAAPDAARHASAARSGSAVRSSSAGRSASAGRPAGSRGGQTPALPSSGKGSGKNGGGKPSSFREGYFEANGAFLKNGTLLSAYAAHLLTHLLKS